MAPSAPDLGEDALNEDWWQRDWAAFKAHRSEETRGFDLKQEQDRAKLAAFQGQEQQRFAAHQQQEEAMFRQHQQWKLNVWHQYQQALQSGRQVPPPPFALARNAPPGAPMPPGMMPPLDAAGRAHARPDGRTWNASAALDAPPALTIRATQGSGGLRQILRRATFPA